MSKPEVWRYRDYFAHIRNGEDYYSPFELDYIEAYRTTNRSIFLDEKWEALQKNMPEKATEHDNVLRLGHLIAFDSHGAPQKDNAERIFKEGMLPDSSYHEQHLNEEEKQKAWYQFKAKWRMDDIENLPSGEHTHGVHFWLKPDNLGHTYSGNVNIKAWLPTNGKTYIKQGDGKQ